MITLKNKDLEPIILTIAVLDENGKVVWGLLTEELTIGTKYRLEKIFKQLVKKYREFNSEAEEIKENLKESEEEMKRELNLLAEKEVTIDANKVDFRFLEDVKTKQVYDFSLLEPILNFQ